MPNTVKLPSIALVSPEIAEEWLKSNIDNRSVRKAHVEALARDMQAGNWQATGDPIKFDRNGILMDGQHRLLAIILSGVTVMLFVIRDLEPEARAVIDTGASRTVADVLSFANPDSKHAKTLAATARIGMMREAGAMTSATAWPRSMKFTHSETLTYLEAHPEFAEVVVRAKASASKIGYGSTALWTYLLAQLHLVDEEAAIVFESSLVDFETKGLGDPRAALLKYLQRNRETRLTAMAVMAPVTYATFRCWNLWRQGKELSRVQISAQAPIPEPI